MKKRLDGEVLKALRKERGLTQDQLAEVSGVSQGTISALERSTSDPAVSTLVALAGALGLSVHEVLERCYHDATKAA